MPAAASQEAELSKQQGQDKELVKMFQSCSLKIRPKTVEVLPS